MSSNTQNTATQNNPKMVKVHGEAFLRACMDRDREFALSFLDEKLVDPTYSSASGNGLTVLLNNRYDGLHDFVSELIARGVPVNNQSSNNGITPLMKICRDNGVPVKTAELLVKNKVRLDDVDSDGWTALYYACNYDNQPMVAFLLKAGADPGLKSKTGKSPRDVAKNDMKAVIDSHLKESFAQEESKKFESAVEAEVQKRLANSCAALEESLKKSEESLKKSEESLKKSEELRFKMAEQYKKEYESRVAMGFEYKKEQDLRITAEKQYATLTGLLREAEDVKKSAEFQCAKFQVELKVSQDKLSETEKKRDYYDKEARDYGRQINDLVKVRDSNMKIHQAVCASYDDYKAGYIARIKKLEEESKQLKEDYTKARDSEHESYEKSRVEYLEKIKKLEEVRDDYSRRINRLDKENQLQYNTIVCTLQNDKKELTKLLESSKAMTGVLEKQLESESFNRGRDAGKHHLALEFEAKKHKEELLKMRSSFVTLGKLFGVECNENGESKTE